MAIDSRRKRASVAGLALAFLGPSVVPDGSFAQGDRQAIAHSYYGINAASGIVEIGGTSQLEAFASSGGITLERVIGGTSQLLAFDATGGITLERTLGGTSQLLAFSSTGGIQVGDVVVADEATPGLWEWYDYEVERREQQRKRREKAKREAQKIKDKLERELALAEREIEEEESRQSELARLNKLVSNNQDFIQSFGSERLNFVMAEALERQTYSTNERLERELGNLREEEMFLLEATLLLVNQ